jgi:hypothetical protein
MKPNLFLVLVLICLMIACRTFLPTTENDPVPIRATAIPHLQTFTPYPTYTPYPIFLPVPTETNIPNEISNLYLPAYQLALLYDINHWISKDDPPTYSWGPPYQVRLEHKLYEDCSITEIGPASLWGDKREDIQLGNIRYILVTGALPHVREYLADSGFYNPNPESYPYLLANISSDQGEECIQDVEHVLSTLYYSDQSVCGIGTLDYSAIAWVEGVQAKQVCDSLLDSIRREGNQPLIWYGILPSEVAYDYEAQCSDKLEGFSYQILGYDGARGREMCRWIVESYGISGQVTTPDLFSIIFAARMEANLQAYAELEALQTIEDAIQATEIANEQSIEATENAYNQSLRATAAAAEQNYKVACLERGGYISEFGNCIVDYPGWPAQRVAIYYDGSWNADRAEQERKTCELEEEAADIGEQSGFPWSIRPEYHTITGVCARGTP